MKSYTFILHCCLLVGVAAFQTHQARLQQPPVSGRALKLGVNQIKSGHNRGNALMSIRGGFLSPVVSKAQDYLSQSPSSLFNGLFAGLAAITLASKVLLAVKKDDGSAGDKDVKPAGVKSLQARFLIVFWLMRMADWLQGPYFYEVYSSKLINGAPVSLDMVSKIFLVGFATTGIFGPWIGRFVDQIGRKAGTLAFAALYAAGALSTQSALLPLLLLGRVAGGLGTSLLFSAPESWMVGEHQREGFNGKWLGQTFGWAYAGDSLVAISAGQLASVAAAKSGPTGPFTLSLAFLALGSLIAALKWGENVAKPDTTAASASGEKKLTIGDAWEVMKKDKKIMLVGAVQALFEGAMYVFVLQWPPLIKTAIQASQWGAAAAIPYGTVFSCFMASCLLGSTLFGALQARNIKVESAASWMVTAAALAMGVATYVGGTNLAALVAAFFVFEACVGMYFPSIGTLRSKYIPDSHRSVIMNLFGVPLNLIVVSVFLSIKSLGVQGALSCATGALAVASVCMNILARVAN